MPNDPKDDDEARRWNYHPGEVRNNPLFDWPPNPLGVLKWYAGFWLEASTTTLCFALAMIAWYLVLPPLETMATPAPGWILTLWLCNLVPHCVAAGGLHWWLIGSEGQGRDLKYDKRDQARSGNFTFGSQLWDNVFWTVVSGVTLWTAFQVLVFWAMANGWAPLIYIGDNPILFVAWFLLIPMWSSFHFYWVHRLLHWPPLYRLAHSLHHRNVNVGPWSGISMHPVEHLLFYTNFLIHLVIPGNPLHLMFHGYVQSTHPVFSHSGFDKVVLGDTAEVRAGVFFHQLHHRYFECNYGTVEFPWDRWFGSYHDGTTEATERTRRTKARMHGESSAR